jgi:hypothetical protein
MAASAVLRREEPPPPRSPERQALAEAVELHRVAAERLQRLRAALSQARRDASDRFSEAERAEEALAEAKRREPHRRAAELLGEDVPSGVSLAEAERVLIEARTAYAELKDVAGVLETEINGSGGNLGGTDGAESRVSYARSGVEQALTALIAADPAFAELETAFDDDRARVAAKAEVFRFLGPSRLPDSLQNWHVQNRPMPEIASLVPAWKAAIDALLRGEADTPLPSTQERAG